jgi:hypothetical protein
MSEENKLLNREVTKEETLSALETQYNQAMYDLEHEFLPQLGHGEAKRLLIAAQKYPAVEMDFTEEPNQALRQAYNACKTVTDVKVALGVEVVIEKLAGDITKLKPLEGEANE